MPGSGLFITRAGPEAGQEHTLQIRGSRGGRFFDNSLDTHSNKAIMAGIPFVGL